MADYTQKISEKMALTGAKFDTAVGGATASLTLTDVDMSEHHRSRVIFIAAVKDIASGTGAQAATAKGTIKSIKLQCSSGTAFGTPSTITTSAVVRTSGGSTTTTSSTAILNAVTASAGGATVSTITASTIATVSLEASGEQIQTQSATNEDRYLRCLCKLAVDASSDRGILIGLYENDLGRYKPVDRTA
jgi:hypothetical protein